MENKNKKALITGAGSGIGLALAKKLLNEGYNVIATSRSGKIEGFEHNNLTVLPLELTDEKSVTDLAAQVKDIDLLINNSGIAPDVFAVVPDKGSFNETLAVNLTGTVFFTEAVLPAVKSNGQILFISSNMGLLKNAGQNGQAYRISKAGINIYAAVLAQRMADRNIRVTPMHPGWVQTRLGGSSAPFTPEQSADALYHGIVTNTETGKFWNAELRAIEE
jgi:NAD(P)-dependent dehydrogenase (short-subunit alcohol dehydrogenase family)